MDPETVDVSQLRAHVARHETYLRTHPNTEQVRRVAANIAAAVAGPSSPLVRKAQQLPPVQSLVPPHGVSSPIARDDRFDTAVEELIPEYYVVIDQIEEFQKLLAANEAMDDDAVVDAVLAQAAKSDQPQWSSALSSALALPHLRVSDALEELEGEGAVEINDRSRALVGTRLFTVTAHGRRLARGSAKRHDIAPTIQVIQHISDSTIASAGVAFAAVEQNIKINPDVREIVDALTTFHAALAEDSTAIAAVTLAEHAKDELRHHGWTEKAASFLKAIPSSLSSVTGLAANAKPAYELVRGLAAAHGVALPPLP